MAGSGQLFKPLIKGEALYQPWGRSDSTGIDEVSGCMPRSHQARKTDGKKTTANTELALAA